MSESIDIFDGAYSVYADGRIYSNLSHKFIKTKVTRRGYEYVCLYPQEGEKKYFFVHRIVTLAFLGELPESLQVNHKDGNKLNNQLMNLEYVTHSENMRHALRTGLRNTIPRGAKHHAAKLTEELVREIRAYYAQGCKQASICRFLNLKPPMVNEVVNNRSWCHVR